MHLGDEELEGVPYDLRHGSSPLCQSIQTADRSGEGRAESVPCAREASGIAGVCIDKTKFEDIGQGAFESRVVLPQERKCVS